jgi:hypothetical protein
MPPGDFWMRKNRTANSTSYSVTLGFPGSVGLRPVQLRLQTSAHPQNSKVTNHQQEARLLGLHMSLMVENLACQRPPTVP